VLSKWGRAVLAFPEASLLKKRHPFCSAPQIES